MLVYSLLIKIIKLILQIQRSKKLLSLSLIFFQNLVILISFLIPLNIFNQYHINQKAQENKKKEGKILKVKQKVYLLIWKKKKKKIENY